MWVMLLMGQLQIGQARAKRSEVLLLPIQASQPEREKWTHELEKQLSLLGLELVLPQQMLKQAAQMPHLQRVLKRAQAAVILAEQSQVQMERQQAIQAARQAIHMLEGCAARYVDPELLGRAYVALGLAELLAPRDEQAAREAFVAALRVYPTLQPDGDRFTPETLLLLKEAHAVRTSPVPPLGRQLTHISKKMSMRTLIWLSIAPVTPQQRRVLLLIYDRRSSQGLLLRQEKVFTQENIAKDMARTIVTTLAGLEQPSSIGDQERKPQRGEMAISLPKNGSLSNSQKSPKPWYKKWWIWTLGGVILVGAGFGIVYSITDNQANKKSNYTFRFHF